MKVRLRHVVVIVPGILGSVLCDERGTRVWGGLPEGVRRLLQPGALDIDVPLEPVTLMPTIRLIGKTLAPGYDNLVKRLQNAFSNAKVATIVPGGGGGSSGNILLFPYDFRAGSRLPPNTWPGRYGTVSARRSTTGGA
ncbi:hypothetical protein ACFQES_47055 [Nonomuraea salmonea]|uniref:hypothetical protein n=1 Tax=Nonomuraea salmonea TaxID=46181 RepID=UPI00362153BB